MKVIGGETGFSPSDEEPDVQLVHRSETGEERILADDVRIVDGPVGKVRGLIGRRPLESGAAIVFRFRGPSRRRIHTIFCRREIDVLWVTNEEVTGTDRLAPWSLGTAAIADTVVELPATAADDVEPGSVVRLVEETGVVATASPD